MEVAAAFYTCAVHYTWQSQDRCHSHSTCSTLCGPQNIFMMKTAFGPEIQDTDQNTCTSELIKKHSQAARKICNALSDGHTQQPLCILHIFSLSRTLVLSSPVLVELRPWRGGARDMICSQTLDHMLSTCFTWI